MSSYVDPSVDANGYLEWLGAEGLQPYADGQPWRMIGDGSDDSKYIPDEIMNDYFLDGIEEGEDTEAQTYKLSWEPDPYGNCQGGKWNDLKPKWGKQGGEVACEVIETPIKAAGDSATEFVIKTCRFPAKKFEDKFYAQEDGHFTPTDLHNMCVMGRSFAQELTGNTRSLAYANSSFDSVPNSNLQSPLLMFYGQKTISKEHVIYPMMEIDLVIDVPSRGYGQDCSAEIARRDNTARVSVESMRNAVENPNTDENGKRDAFQAAFRNIRDANQRVAQKCFPLYNKTGGAKQSLKMDTIAGNIFQIATLPAGDYEEFKQWRGLSDANDQAFREKGLMAFSDSSCRNARSIGYNLCMNLPRAVVTPKVIENVYRRCGYRETQTNKFNTTVRALKKGWEEILKNEIDGIEPRADRFASNCSEEKESFKILVDNISDRVTTNPALGSEGVSCAALKTDMACGTFREGIDLPPVPEFEPGADSKLKTYAYDALFTGNSSCALGEMNLNTVFSKVCGVVAVGTSAKEIDKLLLKESTQQDLARAYGFSLDPNTFSDDCKKLLTPEFRLKCHIMSKVVPDVCANDETTREVCTAFGKR